MVLRPGLLAGFVVTTPLIVSICPVPITAMHTSIDGDHCRAVLRVHLIGRFNPFHDGETDGKCGPDTHLALSANHTAVFFYDILDYSQSKAITIALVSEVGFEDFAQERLPDTATCICYGYLDG